MSMNRGLPILYSFRRCPYAIRARMAIAVSEQLVEHREVDLKEKPVELTQISPKSTVPVLQLNEKDIIEESLEIMHWALKINDPDYWLTKSDSQHSEKLITLNDNDFKQHLDRYKYADRYPESSVEYYRVKASEFPSHLNELLHKNPFILSSDPSLVDIAIFPFIRQFAFVDKNWFDAQEWDNLKKWLNYFLDNDLFKSVMKKHKPWKTGDDLVVFQ